MTPKEHRDRLFKPDKPIIRRLEILDGETYSADMGVLWAAYKAKSFQLPEGLNQEDFVKEIEAYFSKFGQVWVADDRNTSFSKGRGPIGLVMTSSIDLLVEAKFGYFKWATKRNMLRATASFLNMVRHSTKTGICMVRTATTARILPDHLKKYDLLYYVGKVANNEYLYSIRGRGSN